MISRFEESSCNDRRHGIPEEEVSNVTPRPVKPIADEELDSFGHM
jgi:hypothetical protein